MNIYSSNIFLKKIQSLDGSLKNFLIMCVKQNESGSLNNITELRLLIGVSRKIVGPITICVLTEDANAHVTSFDLVKC